jgi:molybdopterin converting factor small subunit
VLTVIQEKAIMSVSIKLSTNFLRREAGFGDFHLTQEVHTIGDLLQYLGRECDFQLIDAPGEKVRPDMEVILNEKDIAFCSAGLKTPLEDGDRVDVFLTPLGGG